MEDDLITLVIERADQKITSPYVRWGIGEDWFDCSGFWYSIFSQLWVVFPSRFTAAMFSSHSRKISKNQIRRGDFMFWDQKPWSKKHNPIYHIEMVVSAPFMRYGKSYVKTLGSSSSKGLFDIVIFEDLLIIYNLLSAKNRRWGHRNIFYLPKNYFI